MANLPAHASPKLAPQSEPPTSRPDGLSDLEDNGSGPATGQQTPALPDSLLSPAFTPLATPGGTLNLDLNPTQILHPISEALRGFRAAYRNHRERKA